MIILIVCHRCEKVFKCEEDDEYTCKYCAVCEKIMGNE